MTEDFYPTPGTLDKTAASALCAWLDREVWLVTARAGERRGGLIATFVSQASLVPELPRMLVGVARQHHTWGLIEASGAFALHLLGPHNFDWVTHFGLRSGRDVDKFEGRTTQTALTGSPILGNSIGWLDCLVETKLDSGDRTVYLGQVVQSQVTHYGPPLTLKQVLEHGTKETLAELKRLIHHDSQIDAQAILAWRAQHGIESKGQQDP
jgi:flavin reductase (DIM6/NTAB) family NADH-FMN oxidoreductase RutF